MGRYSTPKVTYEARVVDLFRLTNSDDYKHEFVVIGDEVYIIDEAFPNPIAISSRIVDLKRDLINPENDELEIGEPRKSFTSQSIDIEDKVKQVIKRADDANEVARNALQSANGKGTNYYGSKEPEKPQEGDTWYRPHPEKPEEEQICFYQNEQWVVVYDSSDSVKRGKILTEINLSEEGIRIAGDRIHLDGQTIIDNGIIGNAHINSLDGNKLTAHSITADKIQTNEVLLPNVDYDGVRINNEGFTLDSQNMKVVMNSRDGFKMTYGNGQEVLDNTYKTRVLSSANFVTDDEKETILTTQVFRGTENVTDKLPNVCFRWKMILNRKATQAMKNYDFSFSIADERKADTWNMNNIASGKSVTIKATDMPKDCAVDFSCVVDEVLAEVYLSQMQD